MVRPAPAYETYDRIAIDHEGYLFAVTYFRKMKDHTPRNRSVIISQKRSPSAISESVAVWHSLGKVYEM